jgi:hypothetical protein
MHGKLAAGLTDGEFSVWTPNTIQYAAADAIAALLAGLAGSASLAMYIEFTNQPAFAPPTPVDRSAFDYYYGAIPATSDFLRVPLVAPASVSPSGPLYAGNIVQVLAQTTDTDAHLGNVEFTRGTSLVVGGGVVLVQDWADPTKDLILTRGYLEEAGQLLWPAAPHDVLLRWAIEIA